MSRAQGHPQTLQKMGKFDRQAQAYLPGICPASGSIRLLFSYIKSFVAVILQITYYLHSSDQYIKNHLMSCFQYNLCLI